MVWLPGTGYLGALAEPCRPILAISGLQRYCRLAIDDGTTNGTFEWRVLAGLIRPLNSMAGLGAREILFGQPITEGFDGCWKSGAQKASQIGAGIKRHPPFGPGLHSFLQVETVISAGQHCFLILAAQCLDQAR